VRLANVSLGVRGKVCVMCTAQRGSCGRTAMPYRTCTVATAEATCDDRATTGRTIIPILTDRACKIDSGSTTRMQKVTYIAEGTTYCTRPCLLDKARASRSVHAPSYRAD
jgi:hypothetical protein